MAACDGSYAKRADEREAAARARGETIMEGVAGCNAPVMSRPLLTVDEAVRRYREAASEVDSARAAQRVTSEANDAAIQRSSSAHSSLSAAGEDLRRAITEAAP